MKNYYWVILVLLVGIVIGTVATYALRLRSPDPDSTTAISPPDPILPAVSALGRIEPQGDVIKLAPNASEAGSRIRELKVKQGDWVTVNQIVAVLDSYDRRLALLNESETQVKQTRARLEQVEAGAKLGEVQAQKAAISKLKARLAGDINVQGARIARLEAEYNNAVIQYERNQSLHEEGALADSILDGQRTNVDTLREQIREAESVRSRLANSGFEEIQEAKANLERIQEVRPVDVAVAEAEVESAMAVVARATAELEAKLCAIANRGASFGSSHPSG